MQSIKEHNLKANHNPDAVAFVPKLLYAIYQRTQSESKSQPSQRCEGAKRSVCNLSKNTIWKQITTDNPIVSIFDVCMQSIKEHNLKANHNSVAADLRSLPSVCNLSKNTIWKQITTTSCWWSCLCCLYAIYQRTQSESKSQPFSLVYKSIWSVCNLSKNTIWKQITTMATLFGKVACLYAIYQRTQSKSKSQPAACAALLALFCMQSIKEHNLKANHNLLVLMFGILNLYAIYQRTQSESKSQL